MIKKIKFLSRDNFVITRKRITIITKNLNNTTIFAKSRIVLLIRVFKKRDFY